MDLFPGEDQAEISFSSRPGAR